MIGGALLENTVEHIVEFSRVVCVGELVDLLGATPERVVHGDDVELRALSVVKVHQVFCACYEDEIDHTYVEVVLHEEFVKTINGDNDIARGRHVVISDLAALRLQHLVLYSHVLRKMLTSLLVVPGVLERRLLVILLGEHLECFRDAEVWNVNARTLFLDLAINLVPPALRFAKLVSYRTGGSCSDRKVLFDEKARVNDEVVLLRLEWISGDLSDAGQTISPRRLTSGRSAAPNRATD